MASLRMHCDPAPTAVGIKRGVCPTLHQLVQDDARSYLELFAFRILQHAHFDFEDCEEDRHKRADQVEKSKG